MAERPCVIEACKQPAGVPGTAKGMCGRHYHKLRKYGDPLAARTLKPIVCAIDACGMERFARDWCSKHFTRWRRFGDPLHRLKGEVRDGRRICPACGQDKPTTEFGRNAGTKTGARIHCKECSAARTSAWRQANPGHDLKPKTEIQCFMCGVAFLGDRRRSSACSIACGEAKKRLDDLTRPRVPEERREANRRWRKKYPAKNWAKSAEYRARKKAAAVERVDRLVVFERDGWTCSICTGPIDRLLAYPHQMSASIDHTRPLARRGHHSYANCRAAHLVCNVRKGARDLAEV